MNQSIAKIIFSTSQPVTYNAGSFWYNPETKKLQVYDNGNWVRLGGSDESVDVSGLKNDLESKVNSFYENLNTKINKCTTPEDVTVEVEAGKQTYTIYLDESSETIAGDGSLLDLDVWFNELITDNRVGSSTSKLFMCYRNKEQSSISVEIPDTLVESYFMKNPQYMIFTTDCDTNITFINNNYTIVSTEGSAPTFSLSAGQTIELSFMAFGIGEKGNEIEPLLGRESDSNIVCESTAYMPKTIYVTYTIYPAV
jgi:hypothetical protein